MSQGSPAFTLLHASFSGSMIRSLYCNTGASGDRVVIRKIESWDYFNYGQVYLIITNEYRLIKRVRRHPKDADNLILLRSENPDYDDIDLPKREIIHLFIVENILSIKNIL